LSAVRDGDDLSFRRLQDMIRLTSDNLVTHLGKLEDAGYLSGRKAVNSGGSQTSVSLTPRGRGALGAYRMSLDDLLGGVWAPR